MSEIVYRNGQQEVTVSNTYKLVVTSIDVFRLYKKAGYPNFPDSWSLEKESIAGETYTTAAMTADTVYRIEAGAAEVFYDQGTAPTISPLDGADGAQGEDVSITGGTSTTSANDGGAVSLTGGTPGATGDGGAASIAGGPGGSTSGAGGAVSAAGGAATAGNSAGGAASLTGGAGSGTQAGGTSNVVGGAGGATGAGGAAGVAGGAGGATSGNGGAASVTGGAGTAGNGIGGASAVTGGAGQGTGAGGAASLTGGASGAGATGNGGVATAGGGDAASTDGNGGNVILDGGAGAGSGLDGMVICRDVLAVPQGAPTAETTAATLTIAELLTGIITGTHAVGGDQAYTLPTGTLTDAGVQMDAGDAFDWTLINLSAAAADTITVTAGVDHTVVGVMVVQSAHATTGGLYGNAGRFRTRKTAANTFVTYRIA